MNIVLRELRAHMKSLIIWSIAQIFIILAGMMKYVGFSKSGVDLQAMLEGYPEGLMKALGMNRVDLTTVEGFYTVFFLYFMLLAAIHAVMLGAVIISKEERDHSADFIYSRPVKRSKVVFSKMTVGVINIIIFNVVTLITSILMIAQNNDGNGLLPEVSLLMLALFFIQLFFLTLGILLGAVMKSTKVATSTATGIVLGTFFLSIASDLSDKVEFLKYITPFKAYQASDVVLDHTMNVVSTIILIVLSVVFAYVANQRFYKRDLSV